MMRLLKAALEAGTIFTGVDAARSLMHAGTQNSLRQVTCTHSGGSGRSRFVRISVAASLHCHSREFGVKAKRGAGQRPAMRLL